LAAGVEALRDAAWNDADVQAVVQRLRTQYARRLNQPASVARRVGDAALHAGNPAYAFEYPAAVGRVTAGDVAAVARRYLQPARRTTIVLTPLEGITPAALTARADMNSVERSLVRATLYPVRRVILDNGVTVLLRRNETEPVIHVAFGCIGGLWCETPLNNGVFTALGLAMRNGTRAAGAARFHAQSARLGLELAAKVNPQTFILHATIAPENLAVALPLLCAAWTAPLLDKPTVNAITSLTLQRLQTQQLRPAELADVIARGGLFENQPYRLNPLGTVASLNAMTWGDVEYVHNDFVTPRATVIVISGAFDDQAIEALLRKELRRFIELPKSRYFIAHQSLFKLSSTRPYVVVDTGSDSMPTAQVTRVFAAARPDTLVVNACLAPPLVCSNYPPYLAYVANAAMQNALESLGDTWRDLDANPMLLSSSGSAFQGWETGWIYSTARVRADAGMSGARRVQATAREALHGLKRGNGLAAAIARARLNYAREMSDVGAVVDTLATAELLGWRESPGITFETALRRISAEDFTRFLHAYDASLTTTIVSPE
jgi:predicted Zn-dependent peptidase